MSLCFIEQAETTGENNLRLELLEITNSAGSQKEECTGLRLSTLVFYSQWRGVASFLSIREKVCPL